MVAGRQRLRVLIVEDSEDDALLILRELRRGAYEPEHERVETPEAMEKALARSAWDVIVSDYRLPRFEAPEALAMAREAGSEAPFVVVSGKIGEAVAVEMMRTGAHDYVMKDNLARLCATVRRALGEAEERRARRRAERELRGSEERYRAIIEQATDGIYLIDARTKRILEANAAFQQLFGYAAEELVGMEVHELIAEGRASVDANIRDTVAAGQRRIGERKYRRKDGLEVNVEVNASVISYGGREVVCAIVRDDTERKRAEERLRASEAELRALFEAMDDVILVLDGEGRYLKVAPTNPSLLYKPSPDLLGKTTHEIFPPEQADEFLGHIRRALETRRTVNFEYALEVRGRQMRFAATISPMLEDSVVWVARDVTGRKKGEEALGQS